MTVLTVLRPSVCLSSVTYVLWLSGTYYRKTVWRTKIWNGLWGIEWSRDRWRHLTLKGQGMTQIRSGPYISKTAGDAITIANY